MNLPTANRSGFPFSQRGSEGDFATPPSAQPTEKSPLAPLLQRGGLTQPSREKY
jgi:hypothetical protein